MYTRIACVNSVETFCGHLSSSVALEFVCNWCQYDFSLCLYVPLCVAVVSQGSVRDAGGCGSWCIAVRWLGVNELCV